MSEELSLLIEQLRRSKGEIWLENLLRNAAQPTGEAASPRSAEAYWPEWLKKNTGLVRRLLLAGPLPALYADFANDFAALPGQPSERPQLDLEPLKRECDRIWEDESPQFIINIAANALHWQRRAIEKLREPSEGLEQVSHKIAEITLHIIRRANETIQDYQPRLEGAIQCELARHFSGGKGARSLTECSNPTGCDHAEMCLHDCDEGFVMDGKQQTPGKPCYDPKFQTPYVKPAALSGEQTRIDIGNLLAELDAHQKNTGHFLEADDAAIVEDIRSRHRPISESNGEPKDK